MKVRIACLLVLLLICATNSVAQALRPNPPSIEATSFILYVPATQTVLLESNSDEQIPPASLTKIMTSYVAAAELGTNRVSLEDEVPISVNAWRAEGSRMFIREGTSVRLEDLLRGIVIQSGNDASVAVAEFIAGSEESFADLMNQYAENMGLHNTNFVNSTGLPNDAHYSTSRDIAILSANLIQNYPEHYRMYRELEFTYADIPQKNRNRMLIVDKSVDGLKTGFTEEAGYCLAVAAIRDGMRLISVVTGTTSGDARVRESRKLLSYGFRNFETQTVFSSGETLENRRIWYGVDEQIPIGIEDSLVLTIERGVQDQLDAKMDLPKYIEAPITEGTQLGELIVTVNGEERGRVSLIALKTIDEKGFFGRVWDGVNLFFTPEDTEQATTSSSSDSEKDTK